MLDGSKTLLRLPFPLLICLFPEGWKFKVGAALNLMENNHLAAPLGKTRKILEPQLLKIFSAGIRFGGCYSKVACALSDLTRISKLRLGLRNQLCIAGASLKEAPVRSAGHQAGESIANQIERRKVQHKVQHC